MQFIREANALLMRRQGELLRIEGWGTNALRVRAAMYPSFTGYDEALTEEVRKEAEVELREEGTLSVGGDTYAAPCARITNGMMTCVVSDAGILTFYRGKNRVLREFYRNYGGTLSKESRCLKVVNREYKPWAGGDYRLTVRFESNDGEKLFGMGQYQQPYLDLKGCTLEMAQKNSQVSVPFAVSSLGFGLLWNNPAVGSATFGKNRTEYVALATKEMDYWITAGESPRKILEQYTEATGRTPMIRNDVLGLWQCKLRYRTQTEVLQVAERYHELGIPVDVIVIDFFHWTYQGDWKFDKKYWPDPKGMVDRLHALGYKVGISVWPSVDKKSEHFFDMAEKGLLIRPERGSFQTYDFQGDCVEIDATNPEAREYIWNICKKNYYDYGIDFFWLDNSEPDMAAYDFDNYRYFRGPAMECSNLYPQEFCRAFYEGERKEGSTKILNLLRSGWAGSQKYATLIWSGDVPSTFEALRDQLSAGLNMGLAGIPWWTTDIGGFMTDDVNDPAFHELLMRWFEFAVFTPILRMHGDRGPHNIPALDNRDFGGGYLYTGQPNELWSYGGDVFEVLKKNLDLRLSMKPYLEQIFEEAHENGSPLMRTMFYEFPEDPVCWEADDQYMFGPDYLVAPILHLHERKRSVYLPEGRWEDLRDHKVYEGGQRISADAPIDSIPVFRRMTK